MAALPQSSRFVARHMYSAHLVHTLARCSGAMVHGCTQGATQFEIRKTVDVLGWILGMDIS